MTGSSMHPSVTLTITKLSISESYIPNICSFSENTGRGQDMPPLLEQLPLAIFGEVVVIKMSNEYRSIS